MGALTQEEINRDLFEEVKRLKKENTVLTNRLSEKTNKDLNTNLKMLELTTQETLIIHYALSKYYENTKLGNHNHHALKEIGEVHEKLYAVTSEG